MSQTTAIMPTVGEIARRLGEPTHRIEYVIRARNIKPTFLAGNLRIFSDADVDRIKRELSHIDEEKARGPFHE